MIVINLNIAIELLLKVKQLELRKCFRGYLKWGVRCGESCGLWGLCYEKWV